MRWTSNAVRGLKVHNVLKNNTFFKTMKEPKAPKVPKGSNYLLL